MLAYISTEIHKSFGPLFRDVSDEQKSQAKQTVATKLAYVAERLDGDHLLGRLSVADFYLFVMLLWAGKNEIAVPDKLAALRDRLMVRESVQRAMKHEGLI